MSRRPHKPGEGTGSGELENTISVFRDNREALLTMLADLDASRRTVETARREWTVTFDAIPDPIFLHDEQYRIVRANRAYAERAGVAIRALIGRPYWEAFPKRDGPLPGCSARLADEDGHEQEVELPGGEVFRVRSYAVSGDDGHARFALHVMEDITQARRAEAERRLMTEALRQAAGAIVLVDRNGQITHVNGAVTQLLGYTPADLVGSPITCLTVPGAPHDQSPAAVVARAQADGAWQGEVLRRHRDGSAVPLHLAVAPIHGADGGLIGIVGTYTDLRPIKQAQIRVDALRQAIVDLATEPDLDVLGGKALDAALALCGADVGAVAVRDGASGRLRYRWVAGVRHDSGRRGLQEPFPPGEGVGGAAYVSGRAVFVPDYQKFVHALPAYRELGVKQAIGVPLYVRGKPMGALSVGAIHGELQGEHAPMVEAIARQLGVALERDALLTDLRLSERRLRDVVERVPDILFSLSLPDLAPTFVSPAVRTLLGYTPEEIVADPKMWLRIVHDDDRHRVVAAVRTSARTGQPLRLEARFWHRDRSALRWFQGSAVLRTAPDGSGTAFGVLTDITERREAEQTLRDSEARLKILFENAPDGIYLIDGQGRFVDGNARAESIVGRARGEVIGRTLAESGIVPPDELPRIQQAFAAQFAGEVLGPMETELLHAEGRRVPVEVHAFPVEVAGELLLMGIARDISERRANEQRYQQLFDSMLDAFAVHEIVVDGGRPVDYRFLAVNRAFERETGLSREQVEGRTYLELFPDGDRKWIEIYGSVALDGSEQRFERFSRELGRHYDVAAFSTRRGQFVTVFRDVSAQVEAERSLERLNRALRTISAGNEALVHAADEQSLLDRVCSVLTGVGGYTLAWVGYAQSDEGRTVKLMAGAGEGAGYLDKLHDGWADNESGQGPAGRAIRSGRAQVEQDLKVAASYGPWRDAALSAGLRASIALPLRLEQGVIGAINVYAREPGAFTAEEIGVLQELAADVSFGIAAQRIKLRHETAVQRLRESEEQFRALFDHANDGILVADVDTLMLTEANDRACEMLGYEKDELLRLRVTDIHPLEEWERIRTVFEKQRRGELELATDLPVLRSDGSVFYADISARPVEFGGKAHMMGLMRDVTERHEAEAEREQAARRLQSALVQTITAVAMTIEKRDPYTAGHQQRVTQLAVAIGRELGLDENRIQGLSLGSLIHDIGKIYIPAEILNRPGRLSPAEFEMIKSHPQVGYDIIGGVEFPWPVAEMVLQHHERLDGSGYPDGASGAEICEEARILAVADVVEAMSSHRPYRPGLGVVSALSEIRKGRGRLYDADAVDACLRLFETGGFKFTE